MVPGVNEIAILVSALLALALGSIWYSPLLFGRHWQRAAGMSDDDLILSRTALVRSLVVAFLGNTVVMYVIATFLRYVVTYDLRAGGLIVLLIALLAASIASQVVWEKKSIAYFLIHTGYASVVIVVGVVVISLWPW